MFHHLIFCNALSGAEKTKDLYIMIRPFDQIRFPTFHEKFDDIDLMKVFLFFVNHKTWPIFLYFFPS